MGDMKPELETTPGVVAVHHQIADALRREIRSGRLAPGDPLPTIADLRTKWNCSSGPVRLALGILRSEGEITGGRGKASAVKEQPKKRQIKLSSISAQKQKDLVRKSEEERAKTGASELSIGVPLSELNFRSKYSRILADEIFANEFGVEEGAEILRRTYETIEKETGKCVLSSTSYIPVKIIESNSELFDEKNEPWPGGHQHQLYTVGIEVDRFQTTVTAIIPTPAEQQKWGMEPGRPMLSLRSRTIDTDDRVVEISDSLYPADRVEMTTVLKLERW